MSQSGDVGETDILKKVPRIHKKRHRTTKWDQITYTLNDTTFLYAHSNSSGISTTTSNASRNKVRLLQLNQVAY